MSALRSSATSSPSRHPSGSMPKRTPACAAGFVAPIALTIAAYVRSGWASQVPRRTRSTGAPVRSTGSSQLAGEPRGGRAPCRRRPVGAPTPRFEGRARDSGHRRWTRPASPRTGTRPLADAARNEYNLKPETREALRARGEHRALVYAVALGTGARRGSSPAAVGATSTSTPGSRSCGSRRRPTSGMPSTGRRRRSACLRLATNRPAGCRRVPLGARSRAWPPNPRKRARGA